MADKSSMDKSSRIYVAGHRGLVGSALVELLKTKGYDNLILATHSELDLMDTDAVKKFFKAKKPEYLIDCAARVGGIEANSKYPAEFLYENLQIQNNLIWQAKENGIKKFLFISTAAVYPNDSPQPIKEEYLMQGEPDPTKSGYAHAKIAGIKFCEFIYDEFSMDFFSVLPNNLYGEKDNFDPKSSHVIPALIRRFHEAKVSKAPKVVIWGSGKARREFIYIEDLADAIIWLMENYDQKQYLNIGTGEDVSMKELAQLIKKLVGYDGELVFDTTKPEGMLRRVYDVSKLHAVGWRHKTSLEEGLKRTYAWYLENIAK
jgi:GDP-L-fucose synthase